MDLITDADSSGTRSVRTILFPVHLLSDDRIRMSTPAFSAYPSTAYEMAAGIGEVYDFYQKGGWYHVEERGDTLIISGYRDNLSAQERQITDSDTRLIWDTPVTLRFMEQDGKRKVVFQI